MTASNVRSYYGSTATGPSLGMPPRAHSRFCVRCAKDVLSLGGRLLPGGMFVCALHPKPTAKAAP